MHKKYFVFLFTLLLFITRMHVNATDNTYVSDYEEFIQSDEYNSIIALEKSTISYFKEILGAEEITLTTSLDTLDYNRIFKVYVDTGLESIETADQQTIQEVLNASNYVWVVPVEVGENHFQITYANSGAAVNSEWKVTEVALRDIPYYDVTLNSISQTVNYSDAVLIGGLPAFHMPVALTFHNSTAQSWIDLGYSESNFQELLGTSNSRSASSNVYDFSTVMTAMQNTTPCEGIGGANTISPVILLAKYFPYIFFGGFAFAIVIISYRLKKKFK